VIVLDTHTLVWWVTGDPLLSKAAKSAIDKTKRRGEIIVSSMSAWEIALLVERDRLVLTMDVSSWLATVEQIEQVRFLSVDVEIATKSVSLPGQFHKDPADRMIVATARKLAVPLVTKDEKLRAYPHVKTIW
jgi:PIN domain nuclease of toxin-antitoxin system